MTLSRRSLLAAGAALPGCVLPPSPEPESEIEMAASGIPPWHMWGGSSPLIAAGGQPAVTGQLARINYGRPETWFFTMGIQVDAGSVVGNPVGSRVTGGFSLIIGVGRSVINIPAFAGFDIDLNVTGGGANLWFSQVPQSQINSNFPAPTYPLTYVSSFSAESIQCNAFIGGFIGPATGVSLIVSALFSPSTHVRPEWYKGQFPGGENKGT